MNVHIERASEADRPSILQLLRDAQLPVDGLVEHLSTAFVARDGAAIVGCAALEIHPEGASYFPRFGFVQMTRAGPEERSAVRRIPVCVPRKWVVMGRTLSDTEEKRHA